MKRGILTSLLFYCSGLALAALSYLIFGHDYVHGPGLHHVIIYLTFLGGFAWLVVATIRFVLATSSGKLKGIIFTNLAMSAGFVLLMVYFINDANDHEDFEQTDEVIIEESGDKTTIYHNGSPVYVKVKDSVLINFIDSTKVKWDEVKRIKK